MTNLVNCPVTFGKGSSELGVFVNSFRIQPESDSECFLDFCLYSARENRAEVLVRLRISVSFLPIIHARLQAELQNLTRVERPPTPEEGKDLRVEDGVVRTPDGRIVFFTKGDGEA